MSDLAYARSLLEIGLPIEVQVPLPDSELTQIYFSQIMDLSEQNVHISAPQRQGQTADILKIGESVDIQLMHAGLPHTLSCKMLGWHHQPEGILLSMPYHLERIQRRRFVRVRTELPVTLLIKDPRTDEQGLLCEPLQIQTRTTDLSGGGMMVSTQEPLDMYTDIEVRLVLPMESRLPQQPPETLAFKAQVCRSLSTAEGYQVGLCFLELWDSTRDKIMRYIFNSERDRRRRSLDS